MATLLMRVLSGAAQADARQFERDRYGAAMVAFLDAIDDDATDLVLLTEEDASGGVLRSLSFRGRAVR